MCKVIIMVIGAGVHRNCVAVKSSKCMALG